MTQHDQGRQRGQNADQQDQAYDARRWDSQPQQGGSPSHQGSRQSAQQDQLSRGYGGQQGGQGSYGGQSHQGSQSGKRDRTTKPLTLTATHGAANRCAT